MSHHFVSAAGFFAFAIIAWLFSADRRKVQWKTVAWGMGLQLLVGLLIFQLPGSHLIFLRLNDAVLALLNVSKSGSSFLFGPLAAGPGEQGSIGFILIFQVLPVAIFFSAFTAALYHLRVLQIIVRVFAKIFHRTMGTSGAESLCGAANIFVGVESALVIRPYLAKMTRSELLTTLGTGMATVASSTLGIYVAFLTGLFPQIAGHLLSASVIAIPAVIVTTKQLLTLVKILGWLFYPLAALLGIARADIAESARLLGERVILTEVVSYQDLAQMVAAGHLSDPRTVVILSYALCGFAHVASMAIFVGGTAALAPSRRDDLAGLGLRALLAATLATLMTGCVAGIFSSGQGVLMMPH